VADTPMLKFTQRPQAAPQKRAPGPRTQDFQEIYAGYVAEAASSQAGRCSQCGVPYCQVHCPLQNNIPDWLKLTAEGRLEEAYELSAATNSMPEVCGRICPQDRLCEGNCVIEKDFDAVTIGSVEKFLTDTAWAQGWVRPLRPAADRGAQSVGIIGAGPAGLAAAEQLRLRGYAVHVYDRYDRAGGLLIYGIPGFKLEKDVVARRVQRLADGGVDFHLNFEIGRDASFAELRAKHDALLIATGVYKARDLVVPGVGLAGVVAALDYLTTSNRQGLGDDVPDFNSGKLNAKDKNVVVIGGGDTAMDCVRTAVRQGAKSIKCLYRRDKANMPGSLREVNHAGEEGVDFVWLAAPEELQGDAHSHVTAVTAHKIRLGAADATGRAAPQMDGDSQFTVPADLVIQALGFEPENLPLMFDAPDLPVTRWGTVVVDAQTQMTAMKGVFAAGDIVRGASLVVWAIRDGRDAAAAMHEYLHAKLAAELIAEASVHAIAAE
jgi:glutamate synthase (NADPH) small chain